MEQNQGDKMDSRSHPSIDPLIYKAQLYQTLSWLLIFPSLGAIAILIMSTIEGTLSGFLESPRLEDAAAVLVIISHGAVFIQSRRFHQLNRSQDRAIVPDRDH